MSITMHNPGGNIIMSETNTGYNLAKISLDLYQRFEDKLDNKSDELIKEANALYDKLDKFVNLRSKLLQDGKEDPEYLDYYKDIKTRELIDLFNEEINVEKENNDPNFYRFDRTDRSIILDRLEFLCKKYQNQAHTKSMMIQPHLLKTLEMTHITSEILRNERESCSHIIRKEGGG